MKIFKKIILGFFLFFFLSFFIYFFVGNVKEAEKINWGIVFSQKHAQLLGLPFKETFLAILDDLSVKNIKIITHWDLIEPEKGLFNFADLDWQIKEAEKREGKLILVLGIKTGRWPECHIPNWAKKLEKRELEKNAIEFFNKIILRYRGSKTIRAWQIENEPFFPFGECPKIEKDFVKKEIETVKSLDPERPIIFADSGEFSFWIEAARLGDIVSATLHRRVYFKEIKKYVSYPIPPVFYWRKAKIIESFFGKKVIIGELQAEPWCKNLIYNCSLEEQKITMDFEKFKENIEFAKKTGFDTFYFWGVEWWYWQKTKRNDNRIWQTAQGLIKSL